MFDFLKNLFSTNVSAINEVLPVVEKTLAKEDEVSKLTTEQLKKKVDELRKELKPFLDKVPESVKRSGPKPVDQKKLPDYEINLKNKLADIIPDFFAIMREINNRKFNRKHFKVQLIASTILAKGNKLTELKTGEGKTQVFHLPAALYGLTKRGAHVITVNDYLARRDGEYAGHAMTDLGISVGVITPQASYKFVPDEELQSVKGEEAVNERKELNIANLSDMRGTNLVECSKQEAYAQDVIYGTANEFGFDYLRDNMVFTTKDRVQRELYFCIVDEADSILIDEARTPLIISAPAEASNQLYDTFAKIARKLERDKDYTVDEKTHSVTLTENGVARTEEMLSVKNLWENFQLAHHLDNALKAEALYKKDDEYIVQNGEVLIVDEFTGRVLPGRRYSEGLHQAIEAKEGVEINRESRTLATITFQNFFRMYVVLCGGSGTIITEAEEFLKIYNLESYVIPTNREVIRKDKSDKIYKNRKAKFDAVANDIKLVHESGQPILVGTASIEDSEYLSGLLDRQGIEHEVLNAKFHEREAAIVAKAGQKNVVTVATNMAGRGTDIQLGQGVADLGGLYIIGTQRHDARRVDNQLRGRGGRQGDPGVTQFFIALDDDVMRAQGGDIIQKIMTFTNLPDDMPIENGMVSRTIEASQKRMEGHHFDIRKRLFDYDSVMNQQREVFYHRRLATIVLTEDAEKQKDQLEELKKQISDLIYEHVFALLQLVDNTDESSLDSLIAGIQDLADDALITKVIKEEFKDKFSGTSLKDRLRTLFMKKDFEEQEKILHTIITEISELKFKELGEHLPEVFKIITLQTMDEMWTEHLDSMQDLREGIGLLGYAQRDPLVEYKNQAYDIFRQFISAINGQIAQRILKVQHVQQQTNNIGVTNENALTDVLEGSREMLEKDEQQKLTRTSSIPNIPVTANKVVGRNDPCPCGSGLKYKKCGLINSPQHIARVANTN